MTKSFTVAYLEEFTDTIIYDEKRDSVYCVVSEQFKREVHRIMYRLDYTMILMHYNEHDDTVAMVFLR